MNVMLDIETYGNNSNSVIVQIGAAIFDEDGGIIDTFKMNIDPNSSINYGMKMDISTIEWWMAQSDEARNSILDGNRFDLKIALSSFSSFIKKNYENFHQSEFDPRGVKIWCHATFDEPIMSQAYNLCSLEQPWHYRSTRDLRTLIDLADIDPHSYNKDGVVHHDALDDCIFQIKYATDAMERLYAKI